MKRIIGLVIIATLVYSIPLQASINKATPEDSLVVLGTESVISNNIDNSYVDSILSKKNEPNLNTIINNVKLRQSQFDVVYKGDGETLDTLANKINEQLILLRTLEPYDMHHVLQSNYSLSRTGKGPIKVSFNIDYKTTNEMETKLDNDLRKLVSEIAPEGMSLQDKALAIHDWIVNNTKYDETFKSNSAYSTFYNKTGTCDGYASLGQKMFTLAGIQSTIAEGTADNVAHAWNMVYMDSKWRHVDITWDDPIDSRGNDILAHDWYGLSDSELIRHTWDKTMFPEAL